MKRLLLLTLVLLFAASAQAVEYRRIGQDYRNLAMGNTGIVTATSSSALFYNPAALANIFNWWVDFPMAQVEYTKDAKDLYSVVQSGGFNLETQQEQLDFMNTYMGSNPHVRVDLGVNAFFPLSDKGSTMGFNYTYEAVLDLAVRNPVAPEIDAYAKLDHVRQFGFSVPLGLGKWVLGLSAKRVERQALSFNYGLQDALNETAFPTLESAGTQGTGIGYDVGLLYRAPSKARLMYGLVWRQKIDLGDAGDVPGELAAGVASFQDLGFMRWTAALDWRDLTYQQGSPGDRSLSRRTHVGMEFGFLPLNKTNSLFSLRTGYNQGYLSTGAEIALGHAMVLGYTKYTEETGEWAGQVGSERTIIYLSLGF
ncbi:MAG: hypothetical protein RRB13_03510 [bacterium]|nr:hypothetical protein [bacterium]